VCIRGPRSKAVVFEEFFAAGLQMLPHLALTDILVKFCMQLHRLTSNALAQFFKYFWAMMSFGEKPSGDGFAKAMSYIINQRRLEVTEVTSISSSAA
jgi:dimeric dUTPase (all-alpha-NTP-PPase superfamily)